MKLLELLRSPVRWPWRKRRAVPGLHSQLLKPGLADAWRAVQERAAAIVLYEADPDYALTLLSADERAYVLRKLLEQAQYDRRVGTITMQEWLQRSRALREHLE